MKTRAPALSSGPPVAVSLSYHDAGRWLDAQETVEKVPADHEVVEALRAFVAEHYQPELQRRKRPDSFRTLQDRFGNPARCPPRSPWRGRRGAMADGFLGAGRAASRMQAGKPADPPPPARTPCTADSASKPVASASGCGGGTSCSCPVTPAPDAPPPPTLADAEALTPASDFKPFVSCARCRPRCATWP